MQSELDGSIRDSMTISAKQQAENKLISSNPRYQMFIAPVKVKTLVPGVCSPAEDFLPEPEGSCQYMGAKDDSCPKDSASTFIKEPYDYNRVVGYINSRYGRMYSWGSSTQLPALQASEWFRDQGHDVFMVWKPELWHINQSRRERWGRDMDNYGYGYPPEAASDTWEVLVATNDTDTPKIRAFQPQGNMTQVMTMESRYPEEALGGTMYGTPQQKPKKKGFWSQIFTKRSAAPSRSYGSPGTMKDHVSNTSGTSWAGNNTLNISSTGSAKILGGKTGVTVTSTYYVQTKTKSMNYVGQWSESGWSTKTSVATYKLGAGKWMLLEGEPDTGFYCDHKEGPSFKRYCTHQVRTITSIGVTMTKEMASPQLYATRSAKNLGVPGTQVKFATNQLSTGQVVPAPHVMPPVYAHVRAPTKWVQNSMFTPMGTLESMESVFR